MSDRRHKDFQHKYQGEWPKSPDTTEPPSPPTEEARLRSCPECGAPCRFHDELHADRSPGYVYESQDREITDAMVERGMVAAKGERWIFTNNKAFRVVIRAILRAALQEKA